MVRRVIGFIAGSAAVAGALSGCLFSYDAAKPHMWFTNDSSQDVVVIVEGLSDEYPQLVASKSSYPDSFAECMGTGIRVETEAGDFLGRVDEQACPDWELTINEDGSLNYEEQAQ